MPPIYSCCFLCLLLLGIDICLPLPVDQSEQDGYTFHARDSILRHLSTILGGNQTAYFTGEGIVDGIVERLVAQLQTAFTQVPFDRRLCKYLIFTIMTIMEGPLARHLTVDVVTVVMHELIMLTILYSQNMTDKVVLLVRAINATIVSFADNADPTVTLSFMIRLLHSPPMDEEFQNDGELNERYQTFTTRMMVKLVKKLPVLLPSLDLEQIFVEIDRFLYLYTSNAQSDVMDLPNRIIKTIVHAVVRYRGRDTVTLLNNIAHITGDANDSTLVHLVNILLESLDDENGSQDTPPAREPHQRRGPTASDTALNNL